MMTNPIRIAGLVVAVAMVALFDDDRRQARAQVARPQEASEDPFAGQFDSRSVARTGPVRIAKRRREVEAETLIYMALEAPISLRCRQSSLEDIVTQFREASGINIVIDYHVLEASGVDPSAPMITLFLSEVSVHSALEHALPPYELGWHLRGEALVITSEDEASSSLELRVYPVGDLIREPDWDPEELDYDSLIEVLTSSVYPQTWDEVGGPGSAAPMNYELLIVSQTREVHEKIELLLSAMRESAGLPQQATRQPHVDEADPGEMRSLPGQSFPNWQLPQVYR